MLKVISGFSLLKFIKRGCVYERIIYNIFNFPLYFYAADLCSELNCVFSQSVCRKNATQAKKMQVCSFLKILNF